MPERGSRMSPEETEQYREALSDVKKKLAKGRAERSKRKQAEENKIIESTRAELKARHKKRTAKKLPESVDVDLSEFEEKTAAQPIGEGEDIDVVIDKVLDMPVPKGPEVLPESVDIDMSEAEDAPESVDVDLSEYDQPEIKKTTKAKSPKDIIAERKAKVEAEAKQRREEWEFQERERLAAATLGKEGIEKIQKEIAEIDTERQRAAPPIDEGEDLDVVIDKVLDMPTAKESSEPSVIVDEAYQRDVEKAMKKEQKGKPTSAVVAAMRRNRWGRMALKAVAGLLAAFAIDRPPEPPQEPTEQATIVSSETGDSERPELESEYSITPSEKSAEKSEVTSDIFILKPGDNVENVCRRIFGDHAESDREIFRRTVREVLRQNKINSEGYRVSGGEYDEHELPVGMKIDVSAARRAIDNLER